MTLNEAFIALRRYEDYRSGRDCRLQTLCWPELMSSIVPEAIRVLLAHHRQSEPIADCRRCKHYDVYVTAYAGNKDKVCLAKQVGECKAFEATKLASRT